MRKIGLSVVAVCILLSGCAAIAENQAARLSAKKRLIEVQEHLVGVRPTCSGDDDCKAKWEVAQLWVVENSFYDLKIVTDVLLETYRSKGKPLAMKVTKDPIGDGEYKLVAYASCSNGSGCIVNPTDAVIDFNKTINAVDSK